MKIIIVGGVAGGASCAARLRRLDEKAEIVIYEKTNYISYANCGLPYYVGNVITDENNLTLQTPKSFKSRFNIDVNVNHEVVSIDPHKKEVCVKNLKTNDLFIDKYDKLVLSPGAKPIVLPFYKESNNSFIIRTVEDTFKIKNYLNNNIVKSAVIIGGGFIGVEMAENLIGLGIDVSLVQLDDHLLLNLDKDTASFVHSECRKNGIKLYLNTEVVDIKKEDNKNIVIFKNGKKLVCDILVCSVGVVPDSILAKNANLKLGIRGSIKVNKSMQTSDSNIYAVGDAVEVKNIITNEESLVSLAGPATKQGRIAADNICGINSEYNGSLASSIIKVFDLSVASTGINETICQRLGLKYNKVVLTPVSHASYYPGSKAITLKIIYEKDSKRMLGAQVIGYEGVDKRIDVLATAIMANIKATSLKDLDLSYAPPYSSSKDPVNMAGFIIDNLENDLVKQFYYEDLNSLLKKDVILLDTRTVAEYERGHAEGFINIPLDNLRERFDELDKNKEVYIMCQSGLRSYIASRILVQNGYIAYNFSGGYRLYSSMKNDEIQPEFIFDCGIERTNKKINKVLVK